jgi:hypothetical protein
VEVSELLIGAYTWRQNRSSRVGVEATTLGGNVDRAKSKCEQPYWKGESIKSMSESECDCIL